MEKRKNELDYTELITVFSPKIKKSLKNTDVQEQEDLEQEIKIKIYEKMMLLQQIQAPGFFEFLKNE
ncbi:hypothetical protein RI119_18485 [Bacillus amyloliquefaciens]|uniref:hypothetical protein n=1 Tax=Bacillus amyloliquefaciens TaxID=1390 RepID=UPI00336B54FA